jgi:hypothetical protein
MCPVATSAELQLLFALDVCHYLVPRAQETRPNLTDLNIYVISVLASHHRLHELWQLKQPLIIISE